MSKTYRLSAWILVLLTVTFDQQLAVAQDEEYAFTTDQSISLFSKKATQAAWSRVELVNGAVLVPKDSQLKLTFNGTTNTAELSIPLKRRISSLELRDVSLDEACRTSLSEFSSLVELQIRECTMHDSFFQDKNPWSESLHRVNVYFHNDKLRDSFFRWLGQCRKLSQISASPALSDKDLIQLKDCTLLESLNVGWSSDPSELLNALSAFSELSSLRISVVDYNQIVRHEALRKLKSIQSMYWLGGRYDTDFFDDLAELPKLRKLEIAGQGMTRISANSAQPLQDLKDLDWLELPESALEGDRKDWNHAFIAMENLKVFPKLREPTVEQIQMLRYRKQLESLSISLNQTGPKSGMEALAKLLRDLNLGKLQLETTIPSSELIEAVSAQKNLRTLSWNVDSFSGADYASWRALDQLEELAIFSQTSMQEPDVLASLKSLKTLKVFASPHVILDGSIFAACSNLERLDMLGGQGDDAFVRSLKDHKKLRILSLTSRFLLTDGGLESLSSCKCLEFLNVSGSFTSNGISKLSSLQSLESVFLSDGRFEGSELTDLLDAVAARNCRVVTMAPDETSVDFGDDGFWRDLGEAGVNQSIEGRPLADFLPKDVAEKCTGRIVVLHLWSSGQSECLEEFQRLKMLQRHFDGLPVMLVGMHNEIDESSAVKQARTRGVDWYQISQSGQNIGRAFGSIRFPCYFLFDRNGVLRVSKASLLGLENGVQKLLQE